jgi:hypothetical protein
MNCGIENKMQLLTNTSSSHPATKPLEAWFILQFFSIYPVIVRPHVPIQNRAKLTGKIRFRT